MINATSLKVEPDEFIAHMLAAGAMSDEQLAMMQSSSGELSAALSGVVWSQLASRYPFSCSSLSSLSMSDVGQLLIAYKELLLRHEALITALEHNQQHASSLSTTSA
eukprot:gene1553-1893_t